MIANPFLQTTSNYCMLAPKMDRQTLLYMILQLTHQMLLIQQPLVVSILQNKSLDLKISPAVRLDPNGLQRLYSYNQTDTNQGASRMLLDTLEVAYFAFFDSSRIVASILGANQLNLVVANLKTKQVTPYIENSGRSIHNIPQSTSVSYTLSNEDKNMDVYILDLDQGAESFFVCQLPVGVQDHCWINDHQLLLGSGSKIYLYDMFGSQQWKEVADLSGYNISDINRITVNPQGNKIALVGTKN